MKFGICSELFVGLPVGEAIDRAAQLGFHGLELAPYTLSDRVASFPVADQREIAVRAAGSGIEILGLHWLLAGTEGLNVTSPDAAVQVRTRDFFRKLVEIAVNTGARILTFGSPEQRSFPETQTAEDVAGTAAELFSGLAPEFEGAGVILALEPLEESYTNFINGTGEARRLAELIGSPSIGITLDLHFLRWECARSGGSIGEAFAAAGSLLAHLHLQDDNNLAPGTGRYDFREYVAAVSAMGWQGYLSIETFGVDTAEQGQEVAARSIEFLKNSGLR